MSYLFHIGYPKTGTTFLQNAVFPRAQGVSFVNRRGTFGERVVEHMVTSTDEQYRAATVRSFYSEVAEGAGSELILTSREALSGQLWKGPIESGKRGLRRIANAVDSPEVLVVVRRQEDMLRSVYGQYVKEGGYVSADSFVRGDVPGVDLDLSHFEYDRLIARCDAVFEQSRVHVWVYEEFRRDPVAHLSTLLARYGCEVPSWPDGKAVNPSLNRTGQVVLRAYNRMFCESPKNPDPVLAGLPGGRRFRKALERVAPQRGWLSSPATFMPPDRARSYAASNQRLNERLGGSLQGLGYIGCR